MVMVSPGAVMREIELAIPPGVTLVVVTWPVDIGKGSIGKVDLHHAGIIAGIAGHGKENQKGAQEGE
jgi:hypothetical protein